MNEHARSDVSRKRVRVDWAEARRLFEVEGLGVVEIARRLGIRRQTVAGRRDAEAWIDRTETAHEAHRAALRAFVERQTDAVLDNLAAKAALTRKVLGQASVYVAQLGEVALAPADGLRALRDAAAILKTLEDVDASLLRDAPWRERPAQEDEGFDRFMNALLTPPPGTVEAFPGEYQSSVFCRLLGPKPSQPTAGGST